MIHDNYDRVLREGYHQRNRAESRVIEFGRATAPLNDSYDALTNWAVIGTVAIGLWCVAVGFAQTVLWLERLVRG